MKICKKIEVLISMDIDNELNEEGKKLLNEHLTGCTKCRNKKDTFLKIKDSFKNDTLLKRKIYKKSIKIYKKNLIVGIIALMLIFFSFFIYIYYQFPQNNIEYSKELPMSSYILKNNHQDDYFTPMISYIRYKE